MTWTHWHDEELSPREETWNLNREIYCLMGRAKILIPTLSHVNNACNLFLSALNCTISPSVPCPRIIQNGDAFGNKGHFTLRHKS